MACGCGKRAKAAARGERIQGYRVTLPNGQVVPPLGAAPFLSPAEARAEIRANGGGTAHTEYAKLAASR